MAFVFVSDTGEVRTYWIKVMIVMW